VAFKSFGLRIGVRANDQAAFQRALRYLPPTWKVGKNSEVDYLYSLYSGGPHPHRQTHRFGLLYKGSSRLVRTLDQDELYEIFARDLRLTVAEFARRRIFIHAGVVGWRGRAILVPGSSYSGKTTLVAELVKAGAAYYSDEYAVLDEKGRVHPFSKPLSIREPNQGGRQTDYPVETFAGRKGVKPLPVGLVLLTEYNRASSWKPRPVSPGKAVLALMAHTVTARNRPEATLETLRQVVSGATVLRGRRGEAMELVKAASDYLNLAA
jgi:hypothetical protein